VTATRAFVRFLVGKGLVASGLVGAVPTVRQWKQASLPNYISADQVAAVVATCSDVSALGRRDRAILLLLVRLGLRASEVASLRLDDIHWREGVISVRGAKSGRERPLPFPTEVGAAVAKYLREGRPRSHQRQVFLAFRAPHQSLSPSAISCIAAKALARADVRAARRGAHVFRHTVATRMVRAGASLKDIADVLGHARLETTSIYAKLDVQKLIAVALPWPEVAP
jgi:site-specific recombinase XerD